MLADVAALAVDHEAALPVAPGGEASLHGFADQVVFDAENVPAVGRRSLLLRGAPAVGRIGDEPLFRAARAERVPPEKHAARISGHHIDRGHGPQPPESAELHRSFGIEGKGLVLRPDPPADVGGIDLVADGAVAVEIDEIGEGWMGRGAVIAFEEVVDADLPIGLDDAAAVGDALHPLEAGDMGLQLRQQAARARAKGLRLRIQVIEDQRAESLDPDRRQAELARLEAFHLLRAAGRAQLARQVIRPCVVRTGDDLAPSAAFQQLMGAMRADVVETAQGAILSAADEDALVVDRRGDIAAWLGQIAHMPGDVPGPEEDRLALAGGDLWRGVQMGGQRRRAFRIAVDRAILRQGFPTRHGVLLRWGKSSSR